MNSAQIQTGPFPDKVLHECYLFERGLASFSRRKISPAGTNSALYFRTDQTIVCSASQLTVNPDGSPEPLHYSRP